MKRFIKGGFNMRGLMRTILTSVLVSLAAYIFLGNITSILKFSSDGKVAYVVTVDESHLQEQYRSPDPAGETYVFYKDSIIEGPPPKKGYALFACLPGDLETSGTKGLEYVKRYGGNLKKGADARIKYFITP